MPNPSQMQDRYGLSLTTIHTGGRVLHRGSRPAAGTEFRPEEQFTQAIEADPEFALAHSALAYMLHLRAQVPEARDVRDRRSRWLRGFPAGSNNRLRRSPCSSMARAPAPMPHPRAPGRLPTGYTDAQAGAAPVFLGCSGAGVASFPAPLLAMMQGVASAYGDDWAFLGRYAFAHHETGHVEEAVVCRSAPCVMSDQSVPPTPSPTCFSRLVTLRAVGSSWTPGSRALTGVRPTTSTSPGIRHCSS